MELTNNLENMRGAIYACLRCNGCTYGPWPENHTFCPVYERGQTFTSSAGGLLYLAKAILNQQLDYNPSLADLAFTCVACSACDSKCVIVRCINPKMALSDIIRLFRYEMVKRGFIPEGPIKKMYEEVKKNGDFLGNGKREVLKIPDEIISDRADILFIAECIHSDSHKSSYNAAFRLLGKMKRHVTLFSDPGCCGSTLYDYGFWDQLPGLVEAKWKKVKSFGDRKLLFLDPHCQEFMTNKYSKIIDTFNSFKGQHFSELLLDAFKKGKMKSKKMKKVKVSYHDPCFLGRGLGIYDPPRRVLACLNGVELIEMKRNKEQSFCCGARGLGNYFEDFSKETAQRRINEFRETGADILITACPYCKEIFGKVMGEEAYRVKDLVEFVNEKVA